MALSAFCPSDVYTRIKVFFDVYDTDGDGVISIREPRVLRTARTPDKCNLEQRIRLYLKV